MCSPSLQELDSGVGLRPLVLHQEDRALLREQRVAQKTGWVRSTMQFGRKDHKAPFSLWGSEQTLAEKCHSFLLPPVFLSSV